MILKSLTKLLGRTRSGKSKPAKNRRMQLEPLEDRRLLSLVGITPSYPIFTYDSTGTVVYDATAQDLVFALDASPLTFKQSAASPTVGITAPRDFQIHLQVDNSGNLISGVPGDDLFVTGNLTVGSVSYSGTLLTGEVTQFGYLDSGAGSTTDRYDFRFTPTGGAMQSFYASTDIGVTTTSERSTFGGGFSTSFAGGAKGNLGAVSALWSSLSGYVYDDGPNNDGVKQGGEAGIAGTTVTLTGVDLGGNPVNLTTTTDGNGYYNFGNLRPGTYSLAETQPAGYLDGTDAIGTPGGTADNDVLSGIVLAAGIAGADNNFGELLPASLAGTVYVDCNNNGQFDPGLGETGIAGATLTLSGTDDLGNAVSATATTDGNGGYSFTGLRPGAYTITETQPAGYLDGTDTIGTPGGTAGNDVLGGIILGAGVTGADNNFGELLPATLAGFVYVDANDNGQIDFGEKAITNVTITLTGTNDRGESVTLTEVTDDNGFYSFTDLRPGTYAITETHPAGYTDGKDTIGTQGGSTANDRFFDIVLTQGVAGLNNNFGEILPTGSPLHAGQTATIGFWHNKNGQALIKSLNGGPTATALGNWLAVNFPNMYGASATTMNLAGKSNAQIAALFLQLFSVKGQKLDAQVLAVAFATYVTNTSLAGGTMASGYGFIIGTQGTGSATYNVGSNGAAFGVANNTTLTILQILSAINDQARKGVLYDANANGLISSAEQTMRNLANNVCDGINNAGDIG